MLSKITLRNLANEDIVMHEDTPTSKRLVITAKGLIGPGNLRQSKRVRPSAQGSINQTRWEEGKTITLEGETIGTSIEDALAQFRAVAAVSLESLEASEEKGLLLKWTEGTSGKELQRLVKLDGDIEPVLQEAAARLVYQAVFFAEDPRAYAQSQSSHTSPSLTVSTAVEDSWIGASAKSSGYAVAVNSEHIYWYAESHIGRATIAGATVEATWLATSPGLVINGIAVNASNIFWSDAAGIGKATLAGGSIENEWRKATELCEGAGNAPVSLAIDSEHIYWLWQASGGGSHYIGRMTLAGGTIEKKWITLSGSLGAVGAHGLAVTSESVYWAHGEYIGRATISGGSVEPEWLRPEQNIQGLATDSTHIYWPSLLGNHIGRAKLTGTELIPAWATGAHGMTGMAADSGHVYSAETGPQTIARASTSGSNLGEAFTLTQNGNRPTPLTLKIHGPIVAPVFVRNSDGARLALEGEITTGNYWEINGSTRTIKLNGTTNVLYELIPTESNWEVLQLAAGAGTSFSLGGGSATAATAECFWRDADV